MTKLFSAFGAADSLEKDRQTVRRALRGIAPDGHENGQPRWRLTTILKALDRRTREVRDGPSSELQRMFFRLDELREKIERASVVEERVRLLREEFFPLLATTGRAMREDGDSVNEDDVRLTLRVEAHERTQMLTLRHLVNWNSDRMLYEFNKATSSDGEAMDPEELIAALFKQSLCHDDDEAT
jgi:hypothetical protein